MVTSPPHAAILLTCPVDRCSTLWAYPEKCVFLSSLVSLSQLRNRICIDRVSEAMSTHVYNLRTRSLVKCILHLQSEKNIF